MPSCEKCWADAHRAMTGDAVALYEELVRTRSCTPEEQAGPFAELCPRCNRKTLHQISHDCMNPDCPKENHDA